MQKKLPIGIDLFEDLIVNDYFYIDKTMLIKEFMDIKNYVTLITRPRRFGKTLNMSMFKCFFDITQRNKDLFDGLKIIQYKNITEKYQNKHPVIFLSLKGVKSPTYEGTMTLLANLISELYLDNIYLYESNLLHEQQKKDFDSFIEKNTSYDELKLSLRKLMNYLYIYHQKKVILLIDEYDAPIDNAEVEGFYPDMSKFMRIFFGEALKTNEYLETGIVTGVQRISKEGLFSDLNNLTVCSILDNYFCDKFGFTEDEVTVACSLYHAEDDIKEVKAFYNGYNFGNKEIYNPWSILNYLREKKLYSYWVNTGSTTIIKNIFAKGDLFLKESVEGLLMDIPVSMSLSDHITYPINYKKTDIFWTMLLNAGYLKSQGEVIPNKKFNVVLVNNEVKESFLVCISNWLNEKEGYFSDGLNEFINSLLNGNAQGIENALNKKLLTSTSYHDMINENSFHMFILGLLQAAGNEYLIRSNREEHDGRADCTLRSSDKSRAAVIIELKHVMGSKATKTKIRLAAQKALKQIEEKQYDKDMLAEGYNLIYKYGIAFNGKYCIVETSL